MAVVAIVLGAGAMVRGSLERRLGAFIGFVLLLFVVRAVFALVVGPIVFGSHVRGLQGHARATVRTAIVRRIRRSLRESPRSLPASRWIQRLVRLVPVGADADVDHQRHR